MPLAASGVVAAKPKEKFFHLSDERGLCLEVSTKGSKWRRFRYRINTDFGISSVFLHF